MADEKMHRMMRMADAVGGTAPVDLTSVDGAGGVGHWERYDDFIPKGPGSADWGVWMIVPAPRVGDEP